MGRFLAPRQEEAAAARVRILWAEGAVANLAAVEAQIEAVHSSRTALKEVRKIIAQVERLARFPHSGRPGRAPGTRELVVAPYVVAYRVTEDSLQSLRVLHGRQRWPARFAR